MPPAELEELWNSAAHGQGVFDTASVAALPEPARRYLTHAIAPGAVLASRVRLRMHGEIKIKRWYPFTAEEVICWGRGFIWAAAARRGALTIRGSDRLVDGQGAMRWKLFGLVPFITAEGADITQSAAGRVNMECTWLPSALCREGVSWTASGESHLRASFTAHGERGEVEFTIDENGAAKSISMQRWGNPEGRGFRYVTFGGFVEKERTFGGYTVPSYLRLGWNFGTERFESEGEFFRATIDDAAYR
jgi:hypothetical protein